MQKSCFSHAGPIALAAMLVNSRARLRSFERGYQAPAWGTTSGEIELIKRTNKTGAPLRLRAASARTFYPLTEDLQRIAPVVTRAKGVENRA